VFPAWLQNLLGNVITLNAIYAKIEDAQYAGDDVALAYWYGRLIRIMIDFEPIPEDGLEDHDMDDFDTPLLRAGPEAYTKRKSSFNSINVDQTPSVGTLW